MHSYEIIKINSPKRKIPFLWISYPKSVIVTFALLVFRVEDLTLGAAELVGLLPQGQRLYKIEHYRFKFSMISIKPGKFFKSCHWICQSHTVDNNFKLKSKKRIRFILCSGSWDFDCGSGSLDLFIKVPKPIFLRVQEVVILCAVIYVYN
jgi:hypothetical protein